MDFLFFHFHSAFSGNKSGVFKGPFHANDLRPKTTRVAAFIRYEEGQPPPTFGRFGSETNKQTKKYKVFEHDISQNKDI